MEFDEIIVRIWVVGGSAGCPSVRRSAGGR